MKKNINSRKREKIYSNSEYKESVKDLVYDPVVQSMKNFIQHGKVSCLSHCVSVSYRSYLVCKFLRFDYRAAARGGLLHDLFLYDWHLPNDEREEKGLHGFTHPYTALRNATKHFDINDIEKDIIKKHMWPLTIKLPRYKESYVVCFVDKYCAVLEFFQGFKK